MAIELNENVKVAIGNGGIVLACWVKDPEGDGYRYETNVTSDIEVAVGIVRRAIEAAYGPGISGQGPSLGPVKMPVGE